MPKQVYYCSPGPMPCIHLQYRLTRLDQSLWKPVSCIQAPLAPASGFLLATNTRLNRTPLVGLLESYVRSFVIFHTLRSWLKTHADGIVSVATAAEKNVLYNFWLRTLIHILSVLCPSFLGNIIKQMSIYCVTVVAEKMAVIISG